MNYKLYKLAFQTAVHFGNGSLEDAGYTFCADTLFSALCQEAVRCGDGVLERLCSSVKDGGLLFSDAFPYMGSVLYLPKPILRIRSEEDSGNSVLKKAYKKLKYIPVSAMESYLSGTYDVLHAPDLDRLGAAERKVSASIRGEEETVPYRVGTYSFFPGNGLYVMVGYQGEETIGLVETLMENLSYSGIGGKRAAGLGRFELYTARMQEELEKRLGNGKRYMSLSVSLPREEELEQALFGAQYLLSKRSGFVSSEHYSREQERKRDLYVFQAGSSFDNRFEGDVYDVSGRAGGHPVYRYAKPMFMEVDA